VTLGPPDCHARLELFERGELHALAEEWHAAGVPKVLAAGKDLETSRAAVDLAWLLPRVSSCVGLHPARMDGSEKLEEFEDAAADSLVVAVGLLGLVAGAEAPLDEQLRVLSWFFALAQAKGVPVLMDVAGAADELLGFLDGLGGRTPAVCVRAADGDAQRLAEAGLYVAFGPGTVGLEDARRVPEGRLLVCSDAAPDGVRPSAVVDVARRLAGARGVDEDELVAALNRNFTRFLKSL
jgi:Tat protein secretion system quality control protein TatD with DNase activity